jgi:hypothetical protein
MFIKNRDPDVVRAQEEELRSTAILDSFVNNILTQIDRHRPFANNVGSVEKLFMNYISAIRAMKRLIDAETTTKYETLVTELRALWETKQREVRQIEENA